MTITLEKAREAHRCREWVRAYEGFGAARKAASLSPEDLSAMADAAWWLGLTDETMDLYEQAYKAHLGAGQRAQAARIAMGVGFLCYLRGEAAVGSGWIGRARRLVREEPQCAERGYLMSLQVDEALAAGEFELVVTRAHEVRQIADLYRDPTLDAVGLVGEGMALVRQGRVSDGMTLLDEAMLAVAAGDVEPSYAGNIYCQMMAVCHDLADLPRARQWTETTERWCSGFPSAVMFAGICRVHRVQLLQARGQWSEAQRQALQVSQELKAMNIAVVAEGHYQVGEIHRLRGDFSPAEQAYRRAHELGRDPQPGLALLRLAEGRQESAASAVRAALAGSGADRLARARLCTAQAEIAMSGGDLETAEAACDELEQIAARYCSVGFEAAARHTRGALTVRQGRPEEALPILRDACRRWRELDAPFEVARVRLALAEAYRALGDADAAELELDAADAAFESLGAVPQQKLVARLRARHGLPGRLSLREAEVLSHVAAGATNRDIAAALVISEKTVARHLSNIFAKIGASSRTEAAAYAYTHGIAARVHD